MVAGKILTTINDIIHPYFSLGLGVAWNDAYNYSAFTNQLGSINITPTFGNQTNTAFAYRLGVGVDVDVYAHTRLGIGYQFNNVGKANTKQGVVTFNDYQASVPFSLRTSNLNANQLVLTLSYFV